MSRLPCCGIDPIAPSTPVPWQILARNEASLSTSLSTLSSSVSKIRQSPCLRSMRSWNIPFEHLHFSSEQLRTNLEESILRTSSTHFTAPTRLIIKTLPPWSTTQAHDGCYATTSITSIRRLRNLSRGRCPCYMVSEPRQKPCVTGRYVPDRSRRILTILAISKCSFMACESCMLWGKPTL